MEGARQEVREVNGESKVEESRSLHEHVDDMDDKHKTHDLNHGECARDDVTMCLQTRRNGTMRTHTQVFVLSVIMVMSSLVYASCKVFASCKVTTQSCPILTFPLLVPILTCSKIQLVVRLYELIVTSSCSHFLHTFAPRKHVI